MANTHTKRCSTSTSHQENANQNHNEASPYTCQMAIIKRQQITSVSEDMKNRNRPTLLLGINIGTATLENSVEGPQNFKTKQPYNLAVTFLGIYPKKIYMLPYVHCSIIYNSQYMETT